MSVSAVYVTRAFRVRTFSADMHFHCLRESCSARRAISLKHFAESTRVTCIVSRKREAYLIYLILNIMDPATSAILLNTVLPAILGTGSSIFSTLMGSSNQSAINKQNQQNFERTLQFQSDMQQKQMDFQRSERMATQEYNSPLNQANLYRAAGLNPLAMMDKGNSFVPSTAMSGGQGSSPGLPNLQAYQPDLSGIASSVSGAINSYFGNIKSQQEAELLRHQNDFAEQKLTNDLLQQVVNIDNSNLEKDMKKVLIKAAMNDLEVSQRTKAYRIQHSRSDAEASQAAADMANSELFDHITLRSIRHAMAETGLRMSQVQIDHIGRQMSLLYQQALTEGTSRSVLKNQARKILQDINIGSPSESKASNLQHARERNPKAEAFLDYFERFMDTVLPFGKLFK